MHAVARTHRGLVALALAAAAALTFGLVMFAPNAAHAATPTPAVTATKTVAPVPTSTPAAAVSTATKPAAPIAPAPVSTPAAAKLPKTGDGAGSTGSAGSNWLSGAAIAAAGAAALMFVGRARRRAK